MAKPNSKPKSCAKQPTIAAMWGQQHKLPQSVIGVDEKVVHKMNKAVMNKSAKNGKREKYSNLSSPNKYQVAKYASYHGVQKTIDCKDFVQYPLKESSVRGWRNQFNSKKRSLGRDPKDASEAGLTRSKRGRKSQFGADHKTALVSYLKALRESGADINGLTTAAAIKAYYVAKKLSNKLVEYGGHIDHMSRSLCRELWKEANFTKRKKTRKRKGKLDQNPSYLASKYKIRRKLTIKKHNIKPCNQMNADETNLPIVPNNAWTMDEKGSKHVEGEKLDDKRNVTGMCGGARTGEAIPLQYIARGTTTRCEPRLKPVPENMRFDHTHNSWSEPESILRYLKHHVVPFTKNQCKKYDLVYDDEHFLMCWDIHYSHIDADVLEYAKSQRIHIIVVPANMTDDLQEMDKGVNGPLKAKLKENFVSYRAQQSVEGLAAGLKPDEIYIDYGLLALKVPHAKWSSNAWKYVEEEGHIEDSFRQVDDNLVGYARWDDAWVQNEWAKKHSTDENGDWYFDETKTDEEKKKQEKKQKNGKKKKKKSKRNRKKKKGKEENDDVAEWLDLTSESDAKKNKNKKKQKKKKKPKKSKKRKRSEMESGDATSASIDKSFHHIEYPKRRRKNK
eukprot:237437_1